MKTFLPFLENYEKSLDKNTGKKGITITVSGLSGVGKGTIAEALAKEFGLQKISSGDLFRKVASEKGTSLEELSSLETDELDNRLEKSNLELAVQGGYVLDGRLTGVVAGENADCRILIECSMNEKTVRVAKRDNLTVEEAGKKLEERDKNNSKKYVRLYGTDGMERDFYDAVIDTTNMDLETTKKEAVKIVRQVLRDKGIL